MSRNILAVGEFYHLYNRGTDKRIIFGDKQDYDRFVVLLYITNSHVSVNVREHLRQGRTLADFFSIQREETLVDIGAYCLMPNHFHILIKEKNEGGTSLFMQKLLTSYSMYFNRKYERNGSLFQGKFKSEHITQDTHLNYLFSYIHLNPVKLVDSQWKERGLKDLLKTKDFLKNYTHSSYLDYQGFIRDQQKILTKEVFPDYFSEKRDFDKFIEDWLQYKFLPRSDLGKV
ncbi:MAG: hypothetical protein RJA61_265 [Candidatus Parcubacteria bacterium]